MALEPVGGHQIAIKKESAFGTYTDYAATDFIRNHTVTFGDTKRERTPSPIARADRGKYYDSLGRIPEVPWDIEIPLWGSNAAGTAVAARDALIDRKSVV
jgi:hypothetical protein